MSVKVIVGKLFALECSNYFDGSIASTLFIFCGREIVEQITLSAVTINDLPGPFINNISNKGASMVATW